MTNHGEKLPEFELFKRIEELEEKIKAMVDPDKVAEFMLDLFVIGLVNSSFAFIALIVDYPREARRMKDEWVKCLKIGNVNKDFVDIVSKMLTEICTSVET